MTGSQIIAFSDLSRNRIEEREIVPLLARDGIVLFSHGTREQLAELLHALADLRGHPDGSFRGATVIEPRLVPRMVGGAGFSRLALPPHTDRALTPRPPTLVAVLIEQAAPHGGQSLFVDTRTLLNAAGLAFFALDLDARAAGTYPVFEVSAGLGRIRFRDDELARPRATLASGRTALAALRGLSTHAVTLALGAGDGYLVHNHRVLHGRTEFRGYRRATRFLAELRPGHPYAWLNDGFQLRD